MVTDDEHVNFPVLVVFLDQFIAILKVLSENVHNLTEDLRAIDIPATLYTLATFISRIEDTDAASLRLKIKFCVLCNSVFGRSEPVMMRNKESNMRQNIADIIVDWVQDLPMVRPERIVLQSAPLTRAVLFYSFCAGGYDSDEPERTPRAEFRHLQGGGDAV